MLSQNFVSFSIDFHGTQSEIKFLRAAPEPLFEQILAYVASYARLTSHNKRIFRQGFETWSVEVKTEQLSLLAELGGFLELQ